ncbi:MAG: hypothetical protein ACTSPG_08870, partial [Candidatus Hodarchaeales archaeon]
NRSMSSGNYGVMINAIRDDKTVGGARYNAGYNVTVQGISTDFTPEYIGYWKSKVSEQKSAWLIKGAISVLCMAIGAALVTAGIVTLFAGVGWVGSIFGTAAMTSAWSVFTGSLVVGYAIYAGIVMISLINPELSAFISTIYFQLEDIIAGVLIHTFVEIMDMAGEYLTGKQIHWWRRNVQPLLYRIYMATYDLKGTVGRYLAAGVYMVLGDDPDEVLFTMYDPFERAMLNGEVYNYLDYEGYFEP